MQYVTTSDGVRIAYLTFGDGPPLVFASNIFGDANFYRMAWPHVREITDELVALGWRVIRYDQRGMGASDRNVSDWSLEARARDLAAVVAHLGLDRFALAGIDAGAATAVAYAVENPASISALVLVSPWISGARWFTLPALRIAHSATAEDDREWKVFSRMLASVVTSFADRELGQQCADIIVQSTSPAGLSAWNQASKQIDLTSLLPRVTIPTLIIHEPAFPFGSFELCQEVAASIPNASFVIVDDTSIAGRRHDGHVTAIDRFFRAGRADAVVPRVRANSPVNGSVPVSELTSRETQVLRLVATGASNKEIAAELAVAVSTIERHLVNLYAKIGARGRADAIGYALRQRLDVGPVQS
jgi:pimeloyl-ACP methyl ester carboxylesterase/DNA-binding CsgD family transcriptional regulator